MENMTTPTDQSNYETVPKTETEVTIVTEVPETSVRKNWKLYAIVCIVGWPLIFVVAFIIYSIESPHEDKIIAAHQIEKAAWQTSFDKLIISYNLSGELLQNITDLIKKAEQLVQTDPGEKKWTLVRAMGFIVETLSTVGYGSISPSTDEGKLTMSLMAFILVPFGALVFGSFGTGIYD